jgi:hypothetical protein
MGRKLKHFSVFAALSISEKDIPRKTNGFALYWRKMRDEPKLEVRLGFKILEIVGQDIADLYDISEYDCWWGNQAPFFLIYSSLAKSARILSRCHCKSEWALIII